MNAKLPDSNKPKTFSTTVDLGIAKKLFKDLESQGFEMSKPAYTLFSGKKPGISCTLYTSGKLLVQGKDTPSFLEFYLEPEILGSFEYTYKNMDKNMEMGMNAHIGIDESGKGDFFGPLCIAGVYASNDSILKLKEMGVRDSKSMPDNSILQLGRKIQKEFDHHIVRINPAKYNELYDKFRNLNHLLAWGHATAIESLYKSTQCKEVLIDQFAAERVVETALKRKGLDLHLTQRHRGEEDVVVAAASILARQAFLEGLENLSREFDTPLPKGASKSVIQAGGKFIRKYGLDNLKKVSKFHFKTLDNVLEENPEYKK